MKCPHDVAILTISWHITFCSPRMWCNHYCSCIFCSIRKGFNTLQHWSVADLGGVRGVQISNNNQAQLHTHVSVPYGSPGV